jgi:cytochrome c553
MADRFRIHFLLVTAVTAILTGTSIATNDTRLPVELPGAMRQHMLANMRDHLAAINEILGYLGKGKLEKAADTAEYRLGMSSLESHGARHMAGFMPDGMRQAGTAMHRAASRFALKAQEGDVTLAYRSLSEVTAACVACHAKYRLE